ncbi:MAG: nucleotidyltransferase domain-containing protein [Candidatus Omnitrophica bacterium]|nr:nucleotidyltransferase domain-containing protein [Candidatus Omnitrophota bacterium]
MHLFKQIVESLKFYHPEKIILFGSYARGKPAKDSEIDLLVIKSTKKDHYRRIPEVRAYLHHLDKAFDILVMTPKEINKRLKLGDFFIEDIIKKGKILYEKKS